MKIKRIILTILLISWIGVIFSFSNQNGEESQKLSDNVTEAIIDKTVELTRIEITKAQKEQLIEDSRFVIRKIAHFSIYFILGIIAYLTIKSYDFKKIIFYTLIICLVYAISDEVHQMFIAERTPHLLDIFIDFSGAFISCMLIHLLINVKNKVKQVKHLQFSKNIV